jgi:hypothetical protein
MSRALVTRGRLAWPGVLFSAAGRGRHGLRGSPQRSRGLTIHRLESAASRASVDTDSTTVRAVPAAHVQDGAVVLDAVVRAGHRDEFGHGQPDREQQRHQCGVTGRVAVAGRTMVGGALWERHLARADVCAGGRFGGGDSSRPMWSSTASCHRACPAAPAQS